MQNTDSVAIVERFFNAIHRLINDDVINGKKTFTDRYGINRRNFLTNEKETDRDIFQTAWLNYLVEDYKVSPLYVLTGRGNFYMDGWDAESVKELQKRAKSVQA